MAITMTRWWQQTVLAALQSSPQWARRAACKGVDPELFQEPARYGKARAYCAACPVVRDCLLEALVTHSSDSFGVWGGTTPPERAAGSTHPRVAQAREDIAGVLGGPWVSDTYVDAVAVLRRSEGEDVEMGRYDTAAAVVRCVTSGRTFEESAQDLRLKEATVRRSWTRSRAAAEANGEPAPVSPHAA